MDTWQGQAISVSSPSSHHVSLVTNYNYDATAEEVGQIMPLLVTRAASEARWTRGVRDQKGWLPAGF